MGISAAAAGAGLTLSQVAALVSGLGGMTALISYMFRWVIPRGTYNEALADRDSWQKLYNEERNAHDATRTALALAAQRSDSGVEAAQVAVTLLDALARERQVLAGGKGDAPAQVAQAQPPT